MAVDLGALVVRLQADMKGFNSGLSKAQRQLQTFSAKLQGSMQDNAQAMQRFGRTAVIAGAAVQGALVGMVKKFGDFELAMRKATTATDITMEEFGELTSFVEEQATALNIAAVEAAEGLKFLGFAGLTAKQQMEAFPPLLKLSKAGMAEMGSVAEKTLGIMGALGIGFEDTGIVADKIAKIWGKSQATLEDLASTFSFAAAGLKEMGLSLGEIGALSALMASAGIKNSRAGTVLRRTFLNLRAPTSELTSLLKQLNIETEDGNGKFRNGIDILDDFFEATKKMGATARASAFKVAFGARSVDGMIVVARKGIDSLRDFAESIKDAGGTVDIMVERRMKALNEQLGIAGREFGNLFRLIGSQFEPEARALAEALRDIADGMQEWIKENETLAKGLAVTAFVTGGLTASVGTLAFALGGLGLAATALDITIGALVVKLTLATGGLTLIGGVLAAAIIDAAKYRAEIRKAEAALNNLNITLDEGKDKWLEWEAALQKSAKGLALLRANIVLTTELNRLKEDLTRALELQKDVGGNLKEIIDLQRKIGSPRKGGLFGTSPAGIIKGVIELLRIEIERTENLLKEREDKAEAIVDKIEAANKVPKTPDKQKFFDFDTEDFNKRVQEWVTASRDLGNNIADAFTSGLDAISDGITDLLFQAEVDFNAIMQSIFKQITAAIIKSAIATAVSGIPGLGGGQGGEKQLLAAQLNQTSSLTNQAAGATMAGASTAMISAAGTMLAAANINAAASAAGGFTGAEGGGIVGLAKGGIVDPVFAASGFVARGTDTVPAMLTPGELVVPRPMTDQLIDQVMKGDTTNVNISVTALDAPGVAKFFKNNKRMIANAVGSSRNENNKLRRNRN